MNRIIDLHTHLETLNSLFRFRSILQHHCTSIKAHNKDGHQVILSTAIYIPLYRTYPFIIKLIKELTKEIAKTDGALLIKSKDDLNKNFNVGIILHIESARTITKAKDQLPQLFELGVRGIIPLHFVDSKIGSSCDDPLRRFYLKKSDNGLSSYGREFIHDCNQLNMWIDLTHTTDKTANDIMALTDKIMVSHVGIRELINWKRNKPLALLKSISKKNGLIGLTPWVHLIGKETDSFEKTIEFAIKNDLSNSICIGTDFGAPISSLPTNRSIFDLSEKIEKLPAYSEEIKWKNAFKFFERILN